MPIGDKVNPSKNDKINVNYTHGLEMETAISLFGFHLPFDGCGMGTVGTI